MKPSKNAPCPCGSGKNYKRCCMNKSKGVNFRSSKAKCNPFFEKYNTIELLKIFSGLSLLPENHGKYIRLEELERTSILNFNIKKETPSAQTLKEFLDENYPSHHLEDPQNNIFTDLVTFYGGDYLLFPGITENGSFILENLFTAIFQWPDSGIPNYYISNCSHAASFVLAISNTIATRLGYKRYQVGKAMDNTIVVSNDEILNQLKAAVTFTTQDIEQLCIDHKIAKEVINEFLIDLSSPDLSSPYLEESPLIYKPILSIDDEFIIVSPATLGLALTDYIWASAERWGCMKQVNEAYQNVLWNTLQMQLGQMKFRRIEVEGITINSENRREGLYRFDEDKIAYVQFLQDTGSNYKNKSDTVAPLIKSDNKDNHKNEVIEQLLSKPEFAGYEIFDFIILSPIGRDFIYPIMKTANARTLALSTFDLDVLWNLKEANAIDLWKYSIALEEQLNEGKIMSTSFLDTYKMYKDNQDSFYLSDETKYNFISVAIGYADDLIQESKSKTDKHSALMKVDDRVANVPVIRKDKYAPVYVHLMGIANTKLEFLVEGFHQAVWVTPNPNLNNPTVDLRNMVWEFNDLIAYWLWQIQDDITDYLIPLGNKPLTFLFDFSQQDKFETIERNFIRDVNLSDKFQTEATIDSCYINIPAEIIPYLYGSDNDGERILVKHLIVALNKLLTNNHQPKISDAKIVQIIDSKVPKGMKKKLSVLDTADNLLLDPRNLEGHRYVQEYDSSIVLNSIVPALGVLCPPVGEIVLQKEKDNLVFNIVQKALLPILRSKINQYDSTELLKQLISQNESLIKEKEILRINTPTRIACFVSVEQHQIDLQKNLGEVNRTTIAMRCLIEHIAAEPSKGSKIISITAIDKLVAIMDQIISWGSLSDQIHYNLFDVRIGVLPSGRIGTGKTHIKEIFDPYYESKTKENISDAISTFNQVFPQNENMEAKDVPDSLDKAFVADYGISFSRICQFITGLGHIGFSQSTPFSSFPLDGLKDAVNKYVDEFDETEFQRAIEYLGLINRGKIEKLPKGYDYVDIMPWRFNRMLSYLRKPLIIVDNETQGGSKTVYWGVRQILASRIYLLDQCQSDRLRVFEDSEVKKELGKFAQKRGNALVRKIIESINPVGLTIDQDVYIGPNYSLKNDIDIGDIDVLIIDTNNKILFSLECKSMSPSRNIKEMIEEVQKLFGSQSEMGWIDKHVRRHDWLEANKAQITAKYNIDISDFKIKSIFITNEDMLTPYLKKQSLPMPFITSYEIEKEGYNTLLKI